MDPAEGPYLPGPNIAKALLMAARIDRRGPKVERGLFFVSPINPLRYDGPRTTTELWETPAFRHTAPARLGGQTTVIRCRPIFPQWACTASLLINPTVLPHDELAEIAATAGLMIGVGDWRPWHGRFTAELAPSAVGSGLT
jgi:hypothetical protein